MSVAERILGLIERRRPEHTLPQPFYTSEDIYRYDIDAVAMKHWVCVGHESMCGNPGDYFVYELDRESVIIVRGEDRVVRAFHNICRHRGSRICYENAGHVEQGLLICPYHAWTYRTDGSMKFGRFLPDGFDKSAHGLLPAHLRVMHGLIFVSLADNPPALDEVQETLDGSLGVLGWGSAKVIHRESFHLEANWKLAVENQMECYHCAPTHPDYARLHSQAKPNMEILTEEMKARTTAMGVGIFEQDRWALLAGEGQESSYSRRYAMSPGYLTGSEDGQPVSTPMGALSDHDGGVTFVYIGPFSFFLAYSDYGAIFRFTPRALNKTEVHVTWLVADDAREGVDYDKDRVTWLWHVTSKADKLIIEKNFQGVASNHYIPGPYILPIESSTNRLTEWYLRDLEDHITAKAGQPQAGD